jgi:hypothetical protein
MSSPTTRKSLYKGQAIGSIFGAVLTILFAPWVVEEYKKLGMRLTTESLYFHCGVWIVLGLFSAYKATKVKEYVPDDEKSVATA